MVNGPIWTCDGTYRGQGCGWSGTQTNEGQCPTCGGCCALGPVVWAHKATAPHSVAQWIQNAGLRDIAKDCMGAVRACDEKTDENGLCACSRFILTWLATFRANEQRAYEALSQPL